MMINKYTLHSSGKEGYGAAFESEDDDDDGGDDGDVWWGWWWWKQIQLDKELLVEFKVTNNSDEDQFYSLSQYNDNVYNNINNKDKWWRWRVRPLIITMIKKRN